MKRILAAGVIAAAAAALLIALAASSIRLDEPPTSRALTEPHSSRGLSALLENYDGGDYAAIARDPTLARPEVYPSPAAAAYREQRPLLGELAWVVSLGDPDRVPIAMALLSVVSTGFAVAALGALLARRGLSPFLALGVFALPGVLVTLYDMMAELLQLGFITVGLLAWETRPRRTRWAIAAFACAALTRETSLLVPAVLIAMDLPRVRRRPGWPTIQLLLVPFVAYAGWIIFLRVRVGAWGFAARSGRITPVPLGGLVHSFRYSPYRASAVPWIAVGLVVLAGAVALGRRDIWYGTAIAFAVMGVFLGWNVWQRPDDFGRVLLPLYAYSAIVLGSALWDRRSLVTLHRARTPAGSGVT